jgi:hypothetical protein
MVINFVTKLVEAKTFKTNIIVIIIKFLYDYILTCFGCPRYIVMNQGTRFITKVI